MKIQLEVLAIAGTIAWLMACPSTVVAKFKVASAYGNVTDHGDYLTYAWHVEVAEDSTEPMYAVHFATESLYQLGYYNFQNSRGWNITERILEPSFHDLTVWYQCTYSKRVFPGESIDLSADIDKRFLADGIGPGVMIMTGLTLSEGGEGIIAYEYVPLAVLHSSTNGMSKVWANQYGLVPPGSRMKLYNAAEGEDTDGDGVCNLQEYIEDTDPTNAESCMQAIVAPSEKGTITVSVHPLSERAVYEVYGAKNENKPMEYLGSFVAEDGGIVLKGKDKRKVFEVVATLRW